MVYTGWADSLVHSRVKKIEDGGSWVGELISFPLDHSTRLIFARYLTVYSTKLFTLVELYMLVCTRYSTAYSTNVNWPLPPEKSPSTLCMDQQVCPLLSTARSVTIFTKMQDDPSNGTYAPKKTYFTINFIYLIHKACQVLSTFTN
jgi:hypothetical protein